MRNEYKAKQIVGIITGARVAELHSSMPGVQAVPGLILDEAPFFSIVNFQHFTVRLLIVGVQEGQAGETLRYGGP